MPFHRSAQSAFLYKGVSALALLVGSSLSAMPAFAAEAPANALAEPVPGEAGLADIVVTARKKAENLRDVPVAITALQGETLKTANITQLVNLTTVVPSFTLSYGSINPYVFIRGFGSGGSPTFDQAVGKFIDNVSFGRDQDGRLPLFDLDRLEVLKGPQVLLYGNSATAGALNITTKKPGNHFEADASVSHEFNNNETNVQGGVTAPIAENVSLRVAGMYQDLARGWMYNTATQQHEMKTRNYAGRAILRAKPAERLTVTLKAEADHVRDLGGLLQPYVQAASPAAYFPEIALDNNRTVNTRSAPFNLGEFAEMNAQTYQGDMQYELLGGTLSSTTSYRRYHFAVGLSNDQPTPAFEVEQDHRYNQFGQELRFNGSYGPVDVTVGGYYENNHFHAFTMQMFSLNLIGVPPAAGGVPFGRLVTFDQTTNSYSGFADLTYRLTNTLSIEAGARYSHIHKTADQSSNPANIVPDITFNTPRSALIAALNPALLSTFRAVTNSTAHSYDDLALSENHFQPQVVLQWKFAPKNMVYAKYVHGAKAGGFDFLYGGSAAGASPDGARFQPETATSWEIGIKGLILDNKLDYALTAFSTTFKDLQVSVLEGTSFLVSNVGKARTQGFEAELHWSPVPHLTISASGTYLDAQYLDFPNATCTPAQTVATPSGSVCRQDLSHTPTQYASKWSGSLGATYERPVGRFMVGGGANVTARTRYNAGSTNDPLMVQGGYAQVDAQIYLAPQKGPWRATFFTRNLTDKQYLDYAVGSPGIRGAIIGALSRGRQLGLRLDTHF